MSANHCTTSDRVAIYLRKSTDDQEQSIERQRGQVKAYAAARHYRVVKEYVDEGIAGDVFDRRPDFQKMLAAAQRREFDVILVDEPSRLSRQNPIELIEKVVAPLRRSAVKMDTVSKGLLDYESLAGIIMMTVHAHKSAEESSDLGRRVLGGMIRKAQAGQCFNWSPPYALRVVRDVDAATGKVLARRCIFGPEEEVLTVRFIFDAVANRGWTLRRICRELEARGVKPPVNGGNSRTRNKAEGRWNASSVRKILRNRKYVGDLVWNETHKGKYFAWTDGKPVEQKTGKGPIRRNAEADVIVVADAIPALMDRDTFARANARLEQARGLSSPKGDENDYLFTHMLVCGDCGAYLRGMPSHGRKVYICARYKEYGTEACRRNTVVEERLWASIFGALKDEILSPARLDAIEAEMIRQLEEERSSGEADRLRRKVKAIDRDIARGNTNLARLPEDRLPGVIAQVRQWEGERAGLLTRLHELENGETEMKALLAEARKQLWRLHEALENGDQEAQAAVVREVLSKVEVRFSHEHTHGKRSPIGKGRDISTPVSAVVYVRPGLGLSCLSIPASMHPARDDA
jgi:site-specific DNA recombinase